MNYKQDSEDDTEISRARELFQNWDEEEKEVELTGVIDPFTPVESKSKNKRPDHQHYDDRFNGGRGGRAWGGRGYNNGGRTLNYQGYSNYKARLTDPYKDEPAPPKPTLPEATGLKIARILNQDNDIPSDNRRVL